MAIKQPGETVRPGDRGPAVAVAKRRLWAHRRWRRAWGFNGGYGPITQGQVKKFQRSRGLEVDAVIGPETWRALNAPAFSRAKGERARAVQWALGCVGMTEQPPNSNQGPRITRWQELSGFPGGGVAWCQCFANASAYSGSHDINPAWFGGYTPAVVEMASAGRHGLRRVHLNEAQPGDWVYFKFPGVSSDFCDHVGIYLSRDGDTVHTVEGNTSAGNSGSQSNGGGVFRRDRAASLIVAVVRPPFKS